MAKRGFAALLVLLMLFYPCPVRAQDSPAPPFAGASLAAPNARADAGAAPALHRVSKTEGDGAPSASSQSAEAPAPAPMPRRYSREATLMMVAGCALLAGVAARLLKWIRGR